jgi:hypothetical protein
MGFAVFGHGQITAFDAKDSSKLSICTRILNAAAVLSGRHGAVTREAQRAGCSRQTVYQHARKLEQRLAALPDAEAAADRRPEERRAPRTIALPQSTAEPQILVDKDKQKEVATIAFAMGLSLRQIEDLLRVLLSADKVPDHSTLGHWVQAEAHSAGAVLAALDPACADRVRTLALDEIFFEGDPPWLGSSQLA